MNRNKLPDRLIRLRLLVLLTLSLGTALRCPLSAEELRLEARSLYKKAVTYNVQLSVDGTAIELEKGELFEDDGPAAGYSYKPNRETLSRTTWIKKELLIPNPQARKATLMVGAGGALRFLINGKHAKFQSAGKVGNYWQAYRVPPKALKQGKNDIILYGSGKVWIARADERAAGSKARSKPPNRSARSTDAGNSWNYDKLGAHGNVDGEYYVRLFLDHYRSRGWLRLPVLDIGNLSGQPVGPPLTKVGPIQVSLQTDLKKAGQILIQARSGTSAVPNAGTWSDWKTLDIRRPVLEKPTGRYVQFTIQLLTNNPLQSPKLKKLTIKASSQRSADWTRKLRVVKSHNEDIIRTSIPFQYEPLDHPRLKLLRRKHKLDAVMQGARSEFDLITRLAEWSSKQWCRGHLGEGYPPWDALEILKPHKDGTPMGGFCQQFNLIFLQACESFGLCGRAVSLGPGGLVNKPRRGGHEVVEIWSNEHRKWVYVDGNHAWYAVNQKTRVPLSLWELRQRQLSTLASKPTKPTDFVQLAQAPRQKNWKGLDQGVPFGELRLIPRSNFLEEKSPLPLNQGMRGWFWTGHHVWTDTRLPASLLYGHRVSNRQNWEWTLNQAHFTLEATEMPGRLRVHLDTETPGFKTFVANIDGKGKHPDGSGFLWTLKSGKNHLEVWPRNLAGRKGISSWIILNYIGKRKGDRK